MSRHSEIVSLQQMRDHAREAAELGGRYDKSELESNRLVALAATKLDSILDQET